MSAVHYIFRDEQTFAIHEGKVIASSTDPDEVQRQVKNANYGEYLEHGGGGGDPDEGYGEEYGPHEPGESQTCPGCGAPNARTPYCPECGTPLSGHGDVHGGQGMENMYPHDEPSPGFEMGGEAGSHMAKTKRSFMDGGEQEQLGSGNYLEDAHGHPGQREWDDPNGPYYDEPCPKCGAREGAYEAGHCMACNYRDPQGQIESVPHLPGDPWDGVPPRPEGDPGYGRQGHVITPNGLKGTVLGKVAGIWGDEVTVRLENGRIVKLPVGTELHTQKTASAPRVNPIERLEARLAATPDGTRASLVARSQELESIKRYASTLIREGVSYADSLRLDQLVVVADTEQTELVAAADYLDDAEAIAPPPFTMAAAHSTSAVSREDASWLDHTVDEMIKEAEATDFTILMDEGPEAFTAGLADVALADADVTREIASSFIAEKTAGIDRKIADPYTKTFLMRVEACRRTEVENRRQPIHKEAAAQEDKYENLPDDALFL